MLEIVPVMWFVIFQRSKTLPQELNDFESVNDFEFSPNTQPTPETQPNPDIQLAPNAPSFCNVMC